jgi:hypothetical protein
MAIELIDDVTGWIVRQYLKDLFVLELLAEQRNEFHVSTD